MLPANFDAITAANIDNLVANGVSESARLDYKQQSLGADSADRREFASDVAAFANSLGGDIIFGVEENGGVAMGAPGVSVKDTDVEIQRLDNILQSSVEPRMPGIRIRAVKDLARAFIVVRIPRSVWGLHMVTANGLQRFVGRNNAGKYPLDVHQIREGFLGGAEMNQRAGELHDSRVADIAKVGDPRFRPWERFLVVHFIPITRLAVSVPIDVAAVRRMGLVLALHPTAADLRLNIDGLVAEGDDTYSTLFRNGVFETASADIVKRETIPSRALVDACVDSLKRYVTLCNRLEITAPIGIFATLYNIHERKMALPASDGPWSDLRGFDRANIRLPSVILESLDTDCAGTLQPMFDALWQAVGSEACSYYDANGNLKPSR